MNTDNIKYTILCLLLLVVQVLVLNNIHLFGCATPLLYACIIINMTMNTSKSLIIFVGFLLGLVSDVFSNTPGVAAASMTLIGLIQPYWLNMFTNRETPEDMKPSINSMGLAKYLTFSFVLLLIFVVSFYSLEEFSFFHWQQWLMCIGGSTIITYVLLITIEQFRKG